MATFNRSMMVNDVGWTKVIFELLYLSRKFQEYIFPNICQRQVIAKHRNENWEFKIGSNHLLNFEPSKYVQKFKTKILGASLWP